MNNIDLAMHHITLALRMLGQTSVSQHTTNAIELANIELWKEKLRQDRERVGER